MIFRVEKTKGYTVMSNYHLRDKNLSLKAKGLLSVILSLPEDWGYSIKGLEKICKEGKASVGTALKELEIFKYLKRERTFDEKGRISGFQYVFYEFPQGPYPENQDMENQDMENRSQLNTNKVITKELNINKINTDVDVPGDESHPVVEQQQQPEDFIFVGTNKNVRVHKSFYEAFKNTYKYYKLVFNALSEYKKKKDISAHCNDEKYLSEWAVIDKEKFEHLYSLSSFDTDDAFEAALKRSYKRYNTEG